jgi:hypothetical protein
MSKTVNASDIISLFGKSVDDPEMVLLMQEKLGTLNRWPWPFTWLSPGGWPTW